MSTQLMSAVIAAAVSALVALTVAFVQYRQARNNRRALVQQDISAKYDRMVEYRLKRPEVLSLARRWEPECFGYIYDHSGPDRDSWAVYYGYVELLIFYCTAVLHAKARGLLDPAVYESQHRSLIRLLLAEHFPILSAIVRPGGYVAQYLIDHVAALQKDGWDWAAAHADLAS